jgi:hypothetical protein
MARKKSYKEIKKLARAARKKNQMINVPRADLKTSIKSFSSLIEANYSKRKFG